jgi:hypothetical protein
MIKVLHIISSLSFDGGVQNMLYNYYSNINRSKIRFDFVVHGAEKGGLAVVVSFRMETDARCL